MLRLSLLALLLANAGYFAWNQGWMASLGWQPESQSEAFRLKQQIRPEAIQIGAPSGSKGQPAAAAATPAAGAGDPQLQAMNDVPGRCWQAGNFDDKQVQALRTALQEAELPPGSWDLQPAAVTGRWMVYLGKFPNTEALDIRRAELRQKNVPYDRAGGNLDPGLSLGRFTSEEAATRELTTILRQGVRGARVVQERADSTLYTLRLPHVTAEMHLRVERIKPALAGKPLRLCDS